MTEQDSTVLVVDDEWTIRQQLSRALSAVGFRCESAANGDDAFEKFNRRRHDLVVTDLRMPARNGHSLATTLLELPRRPKVVVLTGVTEPQIVNDLLKRGIDDIVFKPVNYFEMADGLKQMLRAAMRATAPTPDADPAPQSALPKNPSESNEFCTRMTIAELERRFRELIPDNPWLVAALKWIDCGQLPKPTNECDACSRELGLESLGSRNDGTPEPRLIFRRSIITVPLDHRLSPLHAPFLTRARYLSRREIGLIHNQPINAPHLALAWRSARRRFVILLTRVTHCHGTAKCFDVGAKILRL